jgi:hypothetical protein
MRNLPMRTFPAASVVLYAYDDDVSPHQRRLVPRLI